MSAVVIHLHCPLCGKSLGRVERNTGRKVWTLTSTMRPTRDTMNWPDLTDEQRRELRELNNHKRIHSFQADGMRDEQQVGLVCSSGHGFYLTRSSVEKSARTGKEVELLGTVVPLPDGTWGWNV